MAYHLAATHGVSNVAVIEKGRLAGGNTARNTHTIRSNDLRDVSIRFHNLSVKMFADIGADRAGGRRRL